MKGISDLATDVSRESEADEWRGGREEVSIPSELGSFHYTADALSD